MQYPETLNVLKDIDFVDEPYENIFFEHFFPSIVGYAKLMDEYNANIRSPTTCLVCMGRSSSMIRRQLILTGGSNSATYWLLLW